MNWILLILLFPIIAVSYDMGYRNGLRTMAETIEVMTKAIIEGHYTVEEAEYGDKLDN